MTKLPDMGSFVQRDGPASRSPAALLLYPPIYDFALYDLFLKPYALCRLGAWLSRAGYRVHLVNAMDYTDAHSVAVLGRPRRDGRGTGKFFRRVVPAPSPVAGMKRSFARYGILEESLKRRIASVRPDVVLVSAGMSYWYPGVIEAIRMVREAHPGVPVILGGIYPTLCPQHAEAHSGADAVVSGAAFPALSALLTGLSLPTTEADPAEELLLLPEANWEAGILRLNRGCPMACVYCSSRLIEPRFLPGDPQLLFRTVRKMHRRFGTRCFAFYDDALLCNKERGFLPFLDEVCRSGMSLSFYLPNAVHLRYLDGACAALMKRAGFAEVRVGFESSRPEFHETLDGKLEASMLDGAVRHLREAGFTFRSITAYVLAGLPGQEAGEVELSIRHAASLGMRVRIAEYSPTPGSALWSRAVELSSFDLASEPLTHNNSVLPMRWRGFTIEDLDRLKALTRRLEEPSAP